MDSGMTEKMKKATSEMLFLAFLEKEPRAIKDVTEFIGQISDSLCLLQFPYAIVSRMEDAGYITFAGKVKTPTRKRNYIEITDSGKEYLHAVIKEYKDYTAGINKIFQFLDI